jgi:hypothetical protein
LGLSLPKLPHGFDAEVAEQLFTGAQHARHLGDGTSNGVGVHPPGHPAHVRQLRQAAQCATAEVQAVELQLLRRVGGGGGHHQRPQRRRFARLRPADHCDIALRAR